ncbi:replication associated protein [Sewage associated gemycircularvirus 3]|uniref:Replication-associated protein n=1 Tax=Sewage associated gemycircularvirus 3 TaxID=1843761 RepID=A0A168MGG1_9VIRU|nr:replication associated protein [Sewage associated gemycircularvirus 3]
MTFRFAAKYGLLTYAQIGDRDVEEFGWRVSDMLGSLGAECIVGRESHADGGLHIHAFFMFERKFQSRNVRVFDMDGCHPNIVRGYSTPEDGARYAIKEGDVIAGGLDVDSLGSSVAGSKTVWAQIILAESRDDFFAACAELAPRALLCSFTSLRCYADWKYREDPAPYRHPEDVSFDTSRFPELDRWVQDSLRGTQRGRRRSLILYGPTKLGKTLWARSLGNHAYFGGLFSMDESIDDVDYAVFDDMQGGLKFFHSYKFWLGAQSQFYVTDKYKGKRLVHWGKPCIYLYNHNPLCDEGADHDWLLGNCDIVGLDADDSLLVPEEGSLGGER